MAERLIPVPVDDGRTLAAAQWGDPDGFPVFSLHGTPGSRFARHPDEGAVRDLGIRPVTYDRPGYGGSGAHSLTSSVPATVERREHSTAAVT
jgi:pimeloyl-ACP methyl ester carboxylesterase